MKTAGFTGRRTLAAIAVAGLFAISSGLLAQDVGRLSGKPTKDQILQALSPAAAQPAMRTRGLSIGSGDANKPATQDGGPASSSAPAAKAGPRALDLEIPFEFNSDRLTDDGKEVLDQLGAALKSDELSSAKAIVLEGHTDAKGSAAYNKLLSTRRAQSVKNFLATKHSIPSAKLKAVGKGATELADPKNPEDGVNRRVRIIVEG
jgi:outer membrane protein OmpA-like peptidoglycan-associated protein